MSGALEKPVIAAVNGFAMGGGFMLVERTDLRVAARTAVFEVSEAKRWLLGGYNHGTIANVSFPLAMEMALGFRFTAERFYEIGFLNRLVEPDDLMARRDRDGRASADPAAGGARQHGPHECARCAPRPARRSTRSPPSCTSTARSATGWNRAPPSPKSASRCSKGWDDRRTATGCRRWNNGEVGSKRRQNLPLRAREETPRRSTLPVIAGLDPAIVTAGDAAQFGHPSRSADQVP